MKKCVTCKELKSFNLFHKHKNMDDGYHKQCKQCRSDYAKRRHHVVSKQQRTYTLRSKYGISREEYEALLEKQNHSCAICKKHKSELFREMAVDHCHDTRKIRGLLCSNCNTGIGNLRDSVEMLKRAIEYMECIS